MLADKYLRFLQRLSVTRAPRRHFFRFENLGGPQSNVSMTNSTAAKRTGGSSWKHLIDVHQNYITPTPFEIYEKIYGTIPLICASNQFLTHKKAVPGRDR